MVTYGIYAVMYFTIRTHCVVDAPVSTDASYLGWHVNILFNAVKQFSDRENSVICSCEDKSDIL